MFPEFSASLFNYNHKDFEIKNEVEDIIGIPAQDAPCISAKSGLNVEEVLERIVSDIPAPQGDSEAELQALIFDSLEFDQLILINLRLSVMHHHFVSDLTILPMRLMTVLAQ